MSKSGPDLRIDVRSRGDVWAVAISGAVDEHFRPEGLAELRSSTAPALFDLDGVDRITSYGVREWMRALRSIKSKFLFFTRCRPMVVAQFNSVSDFGSHGQIISLYAPYLCPECDHAFEILLDLRAHPEVVANMAAPAASCPSCKADAEFDDIEDVYFSFVAAQPPLRLPPTVEAVLDGSRAGAPRPFRLAKEVDGELTVLWLKGTIDRRVRLHRYVGMLEGRLLLVLQDAQLDVEYGVPRLREVVRDNEAYLARLPLAAARALKAAGFVERTSLLSVSETGRCDVCGYETWLDVTTWGDEPPEEPLTCPECSTHRGIGVSWTADDAAFVHSLKLAAVPEDVELYLQRHQQVNSDAPGSADLSALPSPKAPSKLGPGATIGNYTILQKLGMGGMAEVFLGKRDGPEGFEKRVVIKRILPHLTTHESFVRMFVQEARIAARISNPHVVQIYDLEQDGSDYFIVMEYVRGADLNAIIKLCTTMKIHMPIEICCSIAAHLLTGLGAAHSSVDDTGAPAPVLHRDVSPHNVLVGLDGVTKLTDFGVAKASGNAALTQTGTLKGKLIYMAPEVLAGEPPSAPTDLFATGLVLYYCLTLYHPFHKANEALCMNALLNEEIPLPETLRPDISPRLSEIVMRGASKDPRTRYQSAREFHHDLERFLVDNGASTGPERLSLWVRGLLQRAATAGVGEAAKLAGVSGEKLDDVTTLTTPAKLMDSEPADSQVTLHVNFSLDKLK